MNNLAENRPSEFLGRRFDQFINRIDTLLMVLKGCKGEVCALPWKTLHPEGGVLNLIHSLDEKYDSFYNSQPKVSFSSCQLGYVIREEGPQAPLLYTAPQIGHLLALLIHQDVPTLLYPVGR